MAIHSIKGLLCIFLYSFCLLAQVYGQTPTADVNDRETLLKAAREIMVAAGTCALITIDDQNVPMVRTMEPFAPEEDFTVWFGTNAESRKVKQLRNNPTVTLYYRDGDSGYVVIHGTAQLVGDPLEKENRWMEHWDAFYPDSRSGYLLIKVSPSWMELLSVSRDILGDSATWETPVIRFGQ